MKAWLSRNGPRGQFHNETIAQPLANIMKNILALIIFSSLIGCDSKKNMSELKGESDKIKLELIGFYKYQAPEETESHYISIDTTEGKLSGLYWGTEDSGGHGIFFYLNELENFKVTDGNISFEIGERDLYESIRFKAKVVGHYADKVKENKLVGVSKDKLKYSGEISEKGFKLNCQSEYGDCWDDKLSFEK